jgi:CRP-like cAMP-binding protein
MLTHTEIHSHSTQAAVRANPRTIAGPAASTAFACGSVTGATLAFERNSEIFGEDEPAEYLYEVTKGAARTYRILSDGRRQVCGFYLTGELFGLEAGETHSCSAEAVTNSSIMLMRRSGVMAAVARDHRLAHSLWRLTARELQHAQAHALLLIKSARERVAAFLLEMTSRVGTGATIELPMSRQDIADYLGLTIETVSRTLTQLEANAAIELPASRHVIVRNRSALAQLNA